MSQSNKVKYGLKNCHYAVATIDELTNEATYGEVKAWFLLRFPEIEEYNDKVNELRNKIKAENEAKKELRKIA